MLNYIMKQKRRIITGAFLLLGAVSFSLLADSPLFANEEGDQESLQTLTPSPLEEPPVSDLPEPVEETDNAALELLKNQQDKIQGAFQPSDIEKEEQQAKSELETVQLEKQTIEEINAEIESELDSLRSQIENQELLKQSLLNAELKTEEVLSQLSELENLKSVLEKDIYNKNALLEKNREQLELLSQEEQLKEYALEQNLRLQKALQDKNDDALKKKAWIFFGITLGFAFLYAIRMFVARRFCRSRKCRKRYAHRFVAFDILSFLAYLGFLVWFFFYLNPEMVVYLLFLVGAIVLVLQEYIFSIFSSLFIVQMYQVGSRVRFDGQEGIIEGITLLKTSIRTIDDLGTNMQELRIIPNSQIMKKEMTVLPRKEIEKTSFKVILPNDLSINQPIFAKHIEEEVLQKNITVKSTNEITETEYFYEIDFSFMSTGQPVIQIFWYETREKSNRIKRKILAELEKFKKASTESSQIVELSENASDKSDE